MGPKEKKAHMLSKVRHCVQIVRESNYLKMEYAIGESPGRVLRGVCRQAFCNVYEVGTTYVKELCRTVKAGIRVERTDLEDTTPKPSSSFVKELTKMAERLGVTLTTDQLASLVVPNTVPALTCFAWMKNFFDSVGDKQPNANEIHLEPTDVKTVHDEYKICVEDAGETALGYDSFLRMWDCCFPHVKIREYKAVSGNLICCTSVVLVVVCCCRLYFVVL